MWKTVKSFHLKALPQSVPWKENLSPDRNTSQRERQLSWGESTQKRRGGKLMKAAKLRKPVLEKWLTARWKRLSAGHNWSGGRSIWREYEQEGKKGGGGVEKTENTELLVFIVSCRSSSQDCWNDRSLSEHAGSNCLFPGAQCLSRRGRQRKEWKRSRYPDFVDGQQKD